MHPKSGRVERARRMRRMNVDAPDWAELGGGHKGIMKNSYKTKNGPPMRSCLTGARKRVGPPLSQKGHAAAPMGGAGLCDMSSGRWETPLRFKGHETSKGAL